MTIREQIKLGFYTPMIVVDPNEDADYTSIIAIDRGNAKQSSSIKCYVVVQLVNGRRIETQIHTSTHAEAKVKLDTLQGLRHDGFVMNLVDEMRKDAAISAMNFDIAWMIRLAKHTLATHKHQGLVKVVDVYEAILRV